MNTKEIRKQYQYGTFVIWPSEDILKIVNKLRKKYDPRSQKICEAHITLTQPFLVKPTDKIWKEIHKVTKEFKSFKITLGPVKQLGKSTTIYLELNPKKKIISLRNKLHKLGFFDKEFPFDFVPHMTISEGGVKNIKKVKNIIKQLNKELSKMNFKCSEVAYIKPNKNFCFKVKRKVRLK